VSVGSQAAIAHQTTPRTSKSFRRR
jgi:hypothetical protein